MNRPAPSVFEHRHAATVTPFGFAPTMPRVEVAQERWLPALQTLQIIPAAPALPQLKNHPIAAKHHEVMVLNDQHQLGVEFLGYTPLFTGVRYYEGVGTDWVVMNLTADPVYRGRDGRLILPGENADRIQRLRQVGLDFEAVFIAHEIPKGFIKPGQTIPIELIAPPPPPELTRRLTTLSQFTEGLWSGVGAALKTMFKIGAATTVAAGALTLGAAALTLGAAGVAAGGLLSLDPVLFGVNTVSSWEVEGQPVGMWYYLTHWWWPPQEVTA